MLKTLIAAGVAFALGATASAADTVRTKGTLFGRTSASVTYGPYIRLEGGRSWTGLSDANWLPPGPSDPRVFFDMSNGRSNLFGIALGYDFMNGYRADVGLISLGKVDATGPWSYTVPADPGPHADITAAKVRTTALMGSLFYAPLEAKGVNSRVQPYLVGGVGLARNSMGDWTRTNVAAPTPVRTFSGESSVDLAYSVGAGVAYQVTRPGQHPVLVDLALRYYDFGTVSGGTATVSGAGSTPREAFNVHRTDTVLSLSIRIPLKRY